jgi:hypothetical protein
MEHAAYVQISDELIGIVKMKRPVKLAAVRKAESEQVGIPLEIPTRVFISYRREDTGETAAHLRYSLGRSLGPEKIFRDMDTIQPGQNFQTTINEALRSTSVCLVLIGPSWLSLKDDKGRRRLDAPRDYVRAEVEAALRLGVEVIPLLVDGAKVPARNQLPESIGELASRNAYELPWISGITKLCMRIEQIERAREAREAAERAARERLDLTGGAQVGPGTWQSNSAVVSFNVITRAMEISLARQGHKVLLETEDLAKSYQTLAQRSLGHGFFFPEIRHIVDFVGVKARKSRRRYIARSYPVRGFAEVPAQLELGRPVLVQILVQDWWLKGPVLRTGVVRLHTNGHFRGIVMGAVLGWDPSKDMVHLLSPWSTWGRGGMGVLTREAAGKYLQFTDACSIEAVLMPESPFTFGKRSKTA